MKKIFLCFLLAIFGFYFVACNEEENPNPDENQQQVPVLNITETTVDLKVGETYTFNVNINVLMQSSDSSIVSTNEASKAITANAEGTATVTIYAQEDTTVSKTVTVNVTKDTVTPTKPVLDIDFTNIDLEVEETFTFDVDIEIKLTSSNAAIVSVNSETKTITALAEGEITLMVYAKEDETVYKALVVSVTDPNVVKPILPESIEVELDKESMYLEETLQIKWKVLPEGASQEVKFATADTSAIDVDENGLVYAKSGRKVNIKITSTADRTVSAIIQIDVKNYIDPEPFFSNFVIERPTTEIVYAFGWNNNTWQAKLNGSVTKYLFEELTINEAFISTSLPERPGTFMKARFIVFHDTAGAGAGENAAWTAAYCGTPTDSSWHYTVDCDGVYQTLPMNEVAWHAGCGTDIDLVYTDTKIKATSSDPAKVTISADGYFEMNGEKTTMKAPLKDDGSIPTNENIPYTGIENYVNEQTGTYWLANTWWSDKYQHVGNYGGNNEGIGIESCVNNGNDIWKTWANAAKLIGSVIMPYTGLTPKDVRQHNSFSGKDCPMTMRHADKWEEFIELITYEYKMFKYFKNFDVKFICDSPYILSNGLVKSLPDTETQIPCQIKVTNTAEGYDKTFNFTVTLGNEYTKNLNNTAPTYMQRFN